MQQVNAPIAQANIPAPVTADRQYPLSENTNQAHIKWLMHKNPVLFTPDADQQWMMEVVAEALDAGVFYTSAMLEHVQTRLANNLPSDYKTRGATAVEGGVLGMESYYARHAVEAKREHVLQVAAAAKIKLGDKINQAEIYFNGKNSKWNGFVTEIDMEYGNVKLDVSRRGDKNRYIMTLPAGHKALSLLVQSRTIVQSSPEVDGIAPHTTAVPARSNIPSSQHTLF